MASSYSCSLIRTIAHFVICVILCSSLIGVAALAQDVDQVGLYFDPGYLENEMTAETLPAIVPTYLVLKNPTASGGVGGWECWLTVDGPGSFLSANLEGSAINMLTPPSFMVGISDAPLPGGNQVLLATFLIQVNALDPITLALRPVDRASIPGQIAYLNADGLDEILPMIPVTGNPTVAVINGSLEQVCVSTPDFVEFPETGLGYSTENSFTVSNPGLVPLNLDIGIVGDCPDFELVNHLGLVAVNPQNSLEITVRFTPSALGYRECILDLGSTCSDIPLSGTGREPTFVWDAPTEVDFGVSLIDVQHSIQVTIVNTGEEPIPILPFIEPSCDAFHVLPADAFTINPPYQATITVYFTPTEAVPYSCTLDLGDVLPPILLTGAGRLPVTSWTATEFLDFGDVDFGQSSTLPVVISNTGDLSFTLNFSIEDCGHVISLDSGLPVILVPGQNHTELVTFAPAVLGEFSCSLGLGETVPAVSLAGRSLTEFTEMTVTPETLVFPMTLAGTGAVLQVNVLNAGNTMIHIEPALDQAGVEFELSSGGTPADLVPGETRSILVGFFPQALGDYAATLSFGANLPVVAISGSADEPVYECQVFPAELDFGTVHIGQEKTLGFRVLNRGNMPLVVDPSERSGLYTVPGGPFTILPGEELNSSVTFRPTEEGFWQSEVVLGPDFCSNIQVAGLSEMPPDWNSDLVGITFDTAYLEYGYFHNSIDAASGSLVVAYLALVNPRTMSPLRGWECCVSLEGPGEFLSWNMEGSAINVLTSPCFMVGLSEPMPPAQCYILATAHIFVLGSDQDIVLRLVPVDFPSIPGEMVYYAGVDGEEFLAPMRSYTALPEVAFINTLSLVGVSAPLPSAELAGGAVNLSWTVGEGDFDGCLVYRREETGVAEVLNQEPLPLVDRSFRFTDTPAGFSSGTVLYYSYSLVREGIELARSPEVEVTLKDMPAMSTRLLPNVPNPFNPQTEIQFELESGGLVRLTIYDVTGKLVRTLVSETLAAGPQSRLWFGEDDHGRRVPSGTYYIRLETDRTLDHRKVLLLK